MGESIKQRQNKRSLSNHELSLRAADMPLSAPTVPTPGSYAVQQFRDEVTVTANELLYGQHTYAFTEIDSLQILKLQKKRSVVQKKLSNVIAGAIITMGLLMVIGAPSQLTRWIGLLLGGASALYVIYFNGWVEQRKQGEFGLLLKLRPNAKVVITSHSLKAIQSLYQTTFRRLDRINLSNETLVVNMYTGEIRSDAP